MGFSVNDYMVRIDLFTEYGKWKYTAAVNMRDVFDYEGPHEALKKAMTTHGIEGLTTDWSQWCQDGFIVCLEPYHKYSYPIVIGAARFEDRKL